MPGRLLSAGKMEKGKVWEHSGRKRCREAAWVSTGSRVSARNRNIPKLSCLLLHSVPVLLGNQQREIQQVQREISLQSVAEAE